MIMLEPKPGRTAADALETAKGIATRIRNGEDFQDLSREFSDAPSSDAGGDVGYVREDMLKKGIAEIAFGMEAGTVSEPFLLDDTVYLLRVDGRRVNDASYRARRAELVTERTEEAFRAHYAERLRELKSHASIEYPP